mmetsp:Transcript_90339/g.173882  ORF Transcript_90339/g.173882 Transcript_90339/m.173882 type:complete len:89 (-) Transcript_90339:1383-1649(-)
MSRSQLQLQHFPCHLRHETHQSQNCRHAVADPFQTADAYASSPDNACLAAHTYTGKSLPLLLSLMADTNVLPLPPVLLKPLLHDLRLV